MDEDDGVLSSVRPMDEQDIISSPQGIPARWMDGYKTYSGTLAIALRLKCSGFPEYFLQAKSVLEEPDQSPGSRWRSQLCEGPEHTTPTREIHQEETIPISVQTMIAAQSTPTSRVRPFRRSVEAPVTPNSSSDEADKPCKGFEVGDSWRTD